MNGNTKRKIRAIQVHVSFKRRTAMHYHFGISYFRRLYLWLGMMVVLLSATPVFAAGLNGACGASNGGLFPVAPTTGLCSAGTQRL